MKKEHVNAMYVNLVKNSSIHMEGGFRENCEESYWCKKFSLNDYIEELQAVQDFRKLHTILCKIKHDFGFTKFAFGIIVPQINDKKKFQILYDVKDSWFTTYIDELLYDDPVSAHALSHSSPLIWSASSDNHSPNSGTSRYWNMLSDFGIKNMIHLPCHNSKGVSGGTRFSYSSSNALSEKDICHILPILSLLNIHVFEAAVRIIDDDSSDKIVELTAREREVLKWVAKGKTTWETSKILEVSENTVLTHMKRIHNKLGVNSRQHAVAKAVNLSIITI